MTTKYIRPEQINILNIEINFLENYLPIENEEHIVGNSNNINESDKYKTLFLKELGLLNQRRKYIIEQLLK